MKKILLSARDPGSINYIIGAYKSLAHLYDIVLYAREPAYRKISTLKISVRKFELSPDQHTGDAIRRKVLEILDFEKPDLVITSTSSLGTSIDEYLISENTSPVLTLQDFWGDINTNLGKYSSFYLCIDNFAKEFTEKRFPVKALNIGSFKYSKYKDIKI